MVAGALQEGALEGKAPPARSFEAVNDALFRERAQMVFATITVATGAFLVLGVVWQEAALAIRFAIKATLLLLAMGGWWLCWRGSSIWVIRAATLLVITSAFGLLAASGIINNGDRTTAPMLIAATLVGAAGMLPWSPGLQAVVAAVGTVAWLVWVSAADAASWYAAASFLVFAISSPLITWSLRAQRRALWLHQEEAQERARQEASVAGSLAVAGGELLKHLGQPDLLSHACGIVREALNADFSVALLAAKDGTFDVAAQDGLSDDEWAAFRLINLPAEIAEAIRGNLESRSFVNLDVGELVPSAEKLNRRDLARRIGVGPVLLLALRPAGHLAGVLVACRRASASRFEAQTMRTADGLAPLVAASVENQKLLDALAAANRTQSEFLAGMSHELRTPLNVITGYLDMLLDGAVGPLAAEQRDLCGRVRASAVQQLSLVAEVLELSRRDDAGRIPVRLEPVDIGTLFAELENELAVREVKERVPVSWRVAPGLPRLRTDPVKLQMILRNLVENGLRYTPEGEVCVNARLDGREMVLEVRDTGVGIAESERERVFDAFRQLEGHRSSGLGLGLHIVRRLAQALAGTVEVTGEVGEGSVFTVRLPVVIVQPSEAADDVEPSSRAS